jgi:hypothetical protein
MIRYIEPNLYISRENPRIEIEDVKLAIMDMATGKLFS